MLLDGIEEAQRHLRELLSGKDEPLLAERPSSGSWSVIENVRHLLFAEQLHLGRFIAGGQHWSSLGLTPHNMRGPKFRLVGSRAPSSMGEALEAWEAVHASTRELAYEDTDEVRKALKRNLRHLHAHSRVIERLLRAGSPGNKSGERTVTGS